MRILWDNKLDDTMTYTPSSENPNYLVTNIYDTRLSRVWKTTGDTSENLVIDAGAGNTIEADTFTISGHNLTSAATLKIQANDTDVWTSPNLDQSITWLEGNIITFFTTTDERYWRFTMVDATNPDGVLDIGRLMLGEYLTITKGASKRLKETISDTTKGYISGSGQYYASQGYRYRTYDLNFPYWTEAMRQSIITMLDSVQNLYPVMLVIDENNMDKLLPCYCVILGDLVVTNLNVYQWSSRLKFRQVM